jgi:hypothetical protein
MTVTDDTEGTRERIAQQRKIPIEVIRVHPNAPMGTVETVADVLREWRERTGISYVTVTGAQTEAFAPVVARLSGT